MKNRSSLVAASGKSRREFLRNGATFAAAGLAGGLSGFPFINRLPVRAQDAPLKFWQFFTRPAAR